MSRHINTHIEAVLINGLFIKALLYISNQTSKLTTLAIYPVTLLASMFAGNEIIIQNEDRLKNAIESNTTEFNLIHDNTLDSISRKLDIIMRQIGFHEFSFGFGWVGLILIVGIIISLIPHITEILTKRFCISFVIFNDYTKTVSNKYIANNEKLKWVVISAVIGIPVALVSAYIRGLLFR
jgi:hypothetical protein